VEGVGVGVGDEAGLEEGVTMGVGVVVCADASSTLTIIKLDNAKTRTNTNVKRLFMVNQ